MKFLHCEMEIPSIAARMIERRYLARLRIDSREVWSLVKIAMLAGVSEIIDSSCTAVLLCNNVLDMKRVRIIVLANSAILAGVSCSGSDNFAGGIIHETTGQGLAWPWP